MKKNALKKQIGVILPLILVASFLTACATGAPVYVGSISASLPKNTEQRTMDNSQINAIIKDLQSDAKHQQKTLKSLGRTKR